MHTEAKRRVQPIQISRNASRSGDVEQIQFLRHCQSPREVMFQKFEAVIEAENPANAGNHREQMTEENALVVCKFG